MSTPAQMGGMSAGEASSLHLGVCLAGKLTFPKPRAASSPSGYLFASSSSSSSGSVAAITTSHSAVAAILPPGPESRVGGRR